ncbi:uncharacterized protein LOC127842481 isoform X2 [Dreissena polymorpha]|uniref:uncharacterized protein LOC127842481 isoform X2 n=2 Tax=Dreissena polymorpha TaxID=45954 RepID=UPI002263C580|nr:uncharacterized protein LOC127842481 isoform X2 [Dreissena polymorpha]
MLHLLCLVFLSSSAMGVYQPHPGARFQWQLEVDDQNPFQYSMQADLYDTDLWAVTTRDITAIHAKGGKVICYFSAGSYDHNRPDAGQFHASDLGNKMDGWDEKWIDIRSSNVRRIMSARMDLAKSKACDGIEPDNVDGHEHGNANFGFTSSDQLNYNKWLASEAHKRNLSIGLKNDAEQIPQLHTFFDWALNEECHTVDGGRECDLYKPFLAEGKAVFNIEYVNGHHVSASDLQKCTSHHPSGMSTQFKVYDVDAWAHHCPGQ